MVKKNSRGKTLEHEISRLVVDIQLGEQSSEYAEWSLWDMAKCQLRKTDIIKHPTGGRDIPTNTLGRFSLSVLPFPEVTDDPQPIIPEIYTFLGTGEVVAASFAGQVAAGSTVERIDLTEVEVGADQRSRIADCLSMAKVSGVTIVKVGIQQ